MKVAMMQPYFLPYLGYFQLINSVDAFVIYDNIQFTKKGWINRNRLQFNNNESLFTINLKKDSDYLDIRDRVISPTYLKERDKLLRKIILGYKGSPFFNDVIDLISEIILYESTNLFEYILNSIIKILSYLEIDSKVLISSKLNIPDKLKGQDRIIATCHHLNAQIYINPIGGIDLYSKSKFSQYSLQLLFLEMNEIRYSQGGQNFMSHLSIIDVLMYNSKHSVQKLLSEYRLN